MPRRLIALLIAAYAIAFAFGAMAAIRWPSLMLVAGLTIETESLGALSEIDWRHLGIAYGVPYFLAALCFYAAALSLGRRKKDALIWYVMGCFSGFPCVFLVDFEANWWRDPSAGEGAVAGAALAAVLLCIAVRELTFGPPRGHRKAADQSQAPTVTATPTQIPDETKPETAEAPRPAEQTKIRHYRPVPAAIARQRAHFAAEGKRMRARNRRR